MASRLKGAALGVLLATSLAGCVSMPSGGPVLSYPVTQGPAGPSQRYPQIIAQPPGDGWTPQQIVQGFLTASASFADGLKTAREYLTPAFSDAWHPYWSATVYSKGPVVSGPVNLKTRQKTAQVTVTGTVRANLSGFGSYAVPSASAAEPSSQTFDLTKVAGGQWRISSAPQPLLLTSDSFQADYQLRNLYFFDPTGHYLVPDPVYVPLQATPVDLMNGLVKDLITPPHDWLYRATRTAFPAGTKPITDVTLDGGTATVNLGGAIAKASGTVLRQVSAQLWWTLSGSGQGGPAVQSVQLSVDGKPWSPPGTQGNPVQPRPSFRPPAGASSTFYYLDSSGNVLRRDGTQGKPVKVAHVGTGYSQIAVSPPGPYGQYLAALRGRMLFTGPLGGRLVRRAGGSYTTMSWDANGNLWATAGDQIVMLRGAGAGRPLGQPVPVTVVDSYNTTDSGPFTSLRVAPDGVRVAIVVGGAILDFGAIVYQVSVRASQPILKIELSPFYVAGQGSIMFDAVTWYGPDNVITLGEPGPVLTEYPVNGGSSTAIPPQSNIQSITASAGNALIAGLAKGGGMMTDASLTGAWTTIGKGSSPTYPG